MYFEPNVPFIVLFGDASVVYFPFRINLRLILSIRIRVKCDWIIVIITDDNSSVARLTVLCLAYLVFVVAVKPAPDNEFNRTGAKLAKLAPTLPNSCVYTLLYKRVNGAPHAKLTPVFIHT